MSYYSFFASSLCDELVYPKTMMGQKAGKWFPRTNDQAFPDLPTSSNEDDEDGEDIAHPIFEQLKNGKKIVNVRICNIWRDDHEMCFNTICTLDDGTKYGVSCWWIALESLVEFFDSAQNAETMMDYIIGNTD